MRWSCGAPRARLNETLKGRTADLTPKRARMNGVSSPFLSVVQRSQGAVFDAEAGRPALQGARQQGVGHFRVLGEKRAMQVRTRDVA